MNESLNITNICEILKNSLPNKKFKVQAEVSQPKISHGHLYLTLKDETSTIKSIIWRSTYEKLKDKLNDGDNITVFGKLDYYGLTGTISFIIDSIIENEGIGSLQLKYDLLKEEFKSKGYFNKENKLKLPLIIKNILIITSSTGAAIHDFLFNLKNNNSKIKYDIIDVPVQGSDSPKIIAMKIDELKNQNLIYDLIVITRGGGSFQDLFGFSDCELIESVNNFKKIPIISAIGHQIDNPLLDLVADFSCPTPSLASQFIVDINKNFMLNLINLKNSLKESTIKILFENQKKMLVYNNILKNSFNQIYNLINNYNNNIVLELKNKINNLEYLKKTLDNPNIELYNLDFIKITDSKILKKNDVLILRWNNKDLKIKII
jgi:exodeoxyribonuclease VII large subunit